VPVLFKTNKNKTKKYRLGYSPYYFKRNDVSFKKKKYYKGRNRL